MSIDHVTLVMLRVSIVGPPKVAIAIKNMTWHMGTSINVDFHEGCDCGGKVMVQQALRYILIYHLMHKSAPPPLNVLFFSLEKLIYINIYKLKCFT